jgi:hypothetical protein
MNTQPRLIDLEIKHNFAGDRQHPPFPQARAWIQQFAPTTNKTTKKKY